MNIKSLKEKATAAELCLIETIIKAHEEDEVDRFIRILNQNIIGMTDAWMDRRQAEGVRKAFQAAVREFREKKGQ